MKKRNTSVIGNIGQAKVFSKFVELGIPVYLPFGEGYVIDLIADFNGKLNKIQIKTTEKLHDSSYMKWRITHQDGYHGSRKKYTSDEVDYFALYCIESDIMCLVPLEEAKTLEVKIRLDLFEGVRQKNMKFVSDYKFEKFIKFK